MRREQLTALGAGIALALACVLAVVVGLGVPALIGFVLGRVTA